MCGNGDGKWTHAHGGLEGRGLLPDWLAIDRLALGGLTLLWVHSDDRGGVLLGLPLL